MVENKALAKESGFSLHAGVSAKTYQKPKSTLSYVMGRAIKTSI
jgi:hypothetical protein